MSNPTLRGAIAAAFDPESCTPITEKQAQARALGAVHNAIASHSMPQADVHEPSWQNGYSRGYSDGVGDGRAEFTNPAATSPTERAAPDSDYIDLLEEVRSALLYDQTGGLLESVERRLKEARAAAPSAAPEANSHRDGYHQVAARIAMLPCEPGDDLSAGERTMYQLGYADARLAAAKLVQAAASEAGHAHLTAEELAFVELVRQRPGHKLNSGETIGKDGWSLWKRPQELGLIRAVGSYKWVVPGAEAQSPVREAVQRTNAEGTLTRCAANRDGECGHAQCPQLRDGEPAKSSRHCPLDTHEDEH